MAAWGRTRRARPQGSRCFPLATMGVERHAVRSLSTLEEAIVQLIKSLSETD